MTELDPRSASPADSAPDEGLSPRAAAEAKKAAAAKAAAAAFIQSAGDDYGNVEAAQPRDVKKGQRTAVIVGLIICVLVAAGVLTYLFTSGFFNKQPVAEETQRVPLSDARVIAAFDEVAMDAPDISQYAYVSQDALIGPKFSDIVLNEPTNLGHAGQPDRHLRGHCHGHLQEQGRRDQRARDAALRVLRCRRDVGSRRLGGGRGDRPCPWPAPTPTTSWPT